jgi:hypothetical protein
MLFTTSRTGLELTTITHVDVPASAPFVAHAALAATVEVNARAQGDRSTRSAVA